jgi:hypothetical protein
VSLSKSGIAADGPSYFIGPQLLGGGDIPAVGGGGDVAQGAQRECASRKTYAKQQVQLLSPKS